MLTAAKIDGPGLRRVVDAALDEDLRYGPDTTSEATTRADQEATGHVAARQPGIVCGVTVALAVLDAVRFPLSGTTIVRRDGEAIEAGDVVLRLSGPLRPILLAERTLLNFMTHLSGVATATNAWVEALQGTNCTVRDTRKTTPGLRELEKYAVRCGGGTNHRLGLGDAALIKDNHIATAGGVTQAVAAVRSSFPAMSLEVECDTLDQVLEALDAGCTLILLDNMDVAGITAALAAARRFPAVRFEASGAMTLRRAVAIARAGVDYIAVGAITHSAPALDLGLDMVIANRAEGR
jgi:nicotinate-nucleotide pyrophosphorylase (carboxylating)